MPCFETYGATKVLAGARFPTQGNFENSLAFDHDETRKPDHQRLETHFRLDPSRRRNFREIRLVDPGKRELPMGEGGMGPFLHNAGTGRIGICALGGPNSNKERDGPLQLVSALPCMDPKNHCSSSDPRFASPGFVLGSIHPFIGSPKVWN